MKQNITISLEKNVIHSAKVLAARQSTSVSALIAQQIRLLVEEDTGYNLARDSALQILADGLRLGGKPLIGDENYEE